MERGGIVVIYSGGVKMTLKVRKTPIETTFTIFYIVLNVTDVQYYQIVENYKKINMQT